MVGNGLETGEKCEKEPEGPSNEGAFQTPADKKPASTPSPSDQLQLQNTPWNGKNDDSENKAGKEDSKVDSHPNGPPASFGPAMSPQVPLFWKWAGSHPP